jgi:hypothetical protein
MGKPLFKASEGGRIDILREWEDITESELQQGSGTKMLLALKVRPEAFPRQRIIFVMTGMSPEGSTDRFTHVRIVRISATSGFNHPFSRPLPPECPLASTTAEPCLPLPV